MGKKSRAKKERKNEPHPTIFVLEGELKRFDDSMLELHTQITGEEWQLIVVDTIQYKIFLDCLKEIAFPILKESWTKEDEWYRLMLDVNIGRMKNLDPLFVATINQGTIKTAFEQKIRTNATEVAADIKKWREQQHAWLSERSDHTITTVSEL